MCGHNIGHFVKTHPYTTHGTRFSRVTLLSEQTTIPRVHPSVRVDVVIEPSDHHCEGYGYRPEDESGVSQERDRT